MCDICGGSPCFSRCPNAPDEPTAFLCGYCDGEIRVGQEYAKIGESVFCMDCCQIKTAEYDDMESEEY